jgi:spermidine synthase
MQAEPSAEKASWHLPASLSALVLTCFFFSGLTGLIYELVWTRMIIKVIGAAPFAVSIILTVFMGGLGLGSFIAAKTIDRVQEPRLLLRLYALLELAIGGYGIILPGLLMLSKPFYSMLYNQLFSHFLIYSVLTLIGCLILLILPSTFMGATLPVLCRFYIVQLGHVGTRSGRLYALNTIGAATGSFVCGFWLIARLGVSGSLLSAVLINSAIGMLCLAASYRIASRPPMQEHLPPSGRTADAKPDPAGDAPSGAASAYRFITLSIFALSGFCAMAYEVIWTKLLGLIIGPTIYSFTIILTTFITGLGLGSLAFGWLADRTGKPLRLLIHTQLFAAVLALGVSQLLGNSQFFFAKLTYHYQMSFGMLSAARAALLFVIMIGPTLFLGATFPLVGKIYTRSLSRIGHSIGFAYTINTIGAVLGSFGAGFLFIPLLGKELSLSLIVGLQLCSALGAGAYLISVGRDTEFLKWMPAGIIALAAALLCFSLPHWNRQQLSIGRYHRFEELSTQLQTSGWLEALIEGPARLEQHQLNTRLLFYGDGIGGFTSVMKITNFLGEDELLLLNSGKGDASSHGDMPMQTLIAHVPLLFRPDARDVLVIGLASGISAGEALLYPIEHLDVVDISEQVAEASSFFIPWNNNVLANPKTALIIQDARAHLELTSRSYDVIIAEPSNPWMAGLANLFTEECFTLARNRLKQDGIFVQMFHSYQMDWSTFSMVGRTFAKVFPHSLLMVTCPSAENAIRPENDYLFIGFNGTTGFSPDDAGRAIAYTRQSHNMTLSNPALLYRLIVSEDLVRLFGAGPIHTDNRPLLEFAAPRAMYTSDPSIEKNLASRRLLSPDTASILATINNREDQLAFAAFALSLYQPFPDMIDLEHATPDQRGRFARLIEEYCSRAPVDDYTVFADRELMERCVSRQIATAEKNISRIPDKAYVYDRLGTAYDAIGKAEQAIAYYQKALAVNPRSPGVLYNLGIAHGNRGDLNAAIVCYKKALDIDPGFARALNNLGNAHIAAGEFALAIEELTRAVSINPTFAEAHNNLGNAYIKKGELDKAIAVYERATDLRPDFAEAHYNLGIAYRKKKRLDKAIAELERAVAIHPAYAKAHYQLAIAYYYDKQYRQALLHCNMAIELGATVDPKLLEQLKPYG